MPMEVQILPREPFYSGLAQLVERHTVNVQVAGSSPASGANLWAASESHCSYGKQWHT